MLSDHEARQAVNHRVKRSSGLLPTPPSLLDLHQDTAFNGCWRRDSGHSPDNCRSHYRQMDRSSSHLHEKSQSGRNDRYDGETETPPPLVDIPHSSAPFSFQRSTFRTPPARGQGFTDDDCNFVNFQPQPRRTMSEPQSRSFPLDRQYSREVPDWRHGSLHEEQDFPRTPLPPRPLRGRRVSQDLRDSLPPPPKVMRRESEPYDRRYSPRHDQPSRRMSAVSSYRQRSGGYDQGFRGSDRAVSLVQNHYEDSSYHRRYNNR